MYTVMINSFIAGFATIIGCLIVLLIGKPSEKVLAWLLGFATGIMLTVVIIDLLPSAYTYSNFFIALLGFFLGNLILLTLDIFLSWLPLLNGVKQGNNRLIKMGYLIAIGIALHDLPEGIAIAVGYSATPELGLIIALAIGLHNIPEGMATAAPLKMGGMNSFKILALTTLVSLITPLGAYLGFIIISISKSLIGLLLAFAGGAMTFIVHNELWPESKRRHPNYSRLGAVCGIVLMLCVGLIH
ncbi:MAG: ZIP family metal transporter [Clostridia bacterium]|jgi:ZIP family zinc transporter|nr:ZIP family metal transporter [Clostridia bacterium]